MSEVKVNKISPRTNCGTVQLGDSGDTITIPAGATITNNGTQTGFGRTGTVDWQTSIKTAASFTASNGEGYFVDTSSNAVTANLPAGSVGAIVAFKDYAQNFDTNALTISANGSDKIEGQTFDLTIDAEGAAVTLVFGDATKGWQAVNSNEITNAQKFISATGGTITTVCTNFKVHTFTGPGTFCVSCAGNSQGSNTVSYLVIAGGGGGGNRDDASAGGGAGGFRESKASTDSYTASPLNATSGPTFNLAVTATSFPITVGAGGASSNPQVRGCNGNPSSFSTITSAGGGFGEVGSGGPGSPTRAGGPGGSGGGGGTHGAAVGAAGAGNTPSVTPPQGNNGGVGSTDNATYRFGGGGGGAGAVGGSSPSTTNTSTGGNGLATSINGTPTTRAGGGGAGTHSGAPAGDVAGAAGGSGGGGAGAGPISTPATAGTANTGGGGGGATNGPGTGAAGGSGIVIIRYKFQ